MSEALAIEQATGMRYVDWEAELAAGSMKAMCAFVWLVWRRDGRDVALEDIVSGDVEVDLRELFESLMEASQPAEADPTQGPLDPAAQAPTPTTATNTSPSSRSSSTSARGRSGS